MKKKTNKLYPVTTEKRYPKSVCQDCGSKANKGRQFQVSTWHIGKCDVCKKKKPVTEPRDFYYPVFEVEK
ncbi:MAG: hypothetical protein QME51_08620 [Planctomycetota bacterium]|nr:hypothetical protein [Planctomycetota bacterium]